MPSGQYGCPKSGGVFVLFCTVVEAIKHMKIKGINMWRAQLIRAAEKGVSRSSWSFQFTSAHEDPAQPPATPEIRTAHLKSGKTNRRRVLSHSKQASRNGWLHNGNNLDPLFKVSIPAPLYLLFVSQGLDG